MTIIKVKKAQKKDYPANWYYFEHGYIFSTSEEYLVIRIGDNIAEMHIAEEKNLWQDLSNKKIYPPSFYLQKNIPQTNS